MIAITIFSILSLLGTILTTIQTVLTRQLRKAFIVCVRAHRAGAGAIPHGPGRSALREHDAGGENSGTDRCDFVF